MDENRKKEIDAAWRRSRRAQFFDDLRRIKLGWIALLVAIMALIAATVAIYRTRPSLVETLEGRIIAEFAEPSAKHSMGQTWRAQVQLDDGRTVTLLMPRGEVLRRDAPIKVRHARRSVGPITHDDYRFAGYAEADG